MAAVCFLPWGPWQPKQQCERDSRQKICFQQRPLLLTYRKLRDSTQLLGDGQQMFAIVLQPWKMIQLRACAMTGIAMAMLAAMT